MNTLITTAIMGLFLILCLLSSGCTGLIGEGMFQSEGEGRLLLSADAEGLSEFGQMMNGLVSNARSENPNDSPYWEARRLRIISRHKGVSIGKKKAPQRAQNGK